MIKEGRLLAKISEHVVVKVPLNAEGLTATRALADDGIDVNVTLIFQPAQALMAAKAGAAYVSPFLGRLDDIATDGVQLIEEIVTIFGNYQSWGQRRFLPLSDTRFMCRRLLSRVPMWRRFRTRSCHAW